MDLEYTVEDMVGTIRLNRPHRKNSFTYDMIDSWAAALREANADDQVRAVVVTGTEDSFCAGVDLQRREDVADVPYARAQVLRERVHSVAREVQRLHKPLIAALNGVAVGAGMDMALMCDIRWAAETARMSQGYIRVGLVPGDGGCYTLPRLAGTAKALELMWTGDFVTAHEAAELGIVTKVLKPESLMEQTYDFACRLAAAPPIAVSAIKRVTYRSLTLDFQTSLDLAAAESAVVQSTQDSGEARAAFQERRTGHYIGS